MEQEREARLLAQKQLQAILGTNPNPKPEPNQVAERSAACGLLVEASDVLPQAARLRVGVGVRVRVRVRVWLRVRVRVRVS